MRRKNRTKLLSVILISGVIFFLFIIAGTFIYAQNPVTDTVQIEPTKAKEVLVIFEVDLKGLTPKPIQVGALTDALTAEFTEAGNYNLVDRDTLYYYFKQIQEKTKKPCTGPECLADLAANLDADLFVKAEVSKAGKECRFSVKLYKRKPQTVLYFVDQTKIESCSCQAAGLEKAAKALGKKLTSWEVVEVGKEIIPPGTKGGPMAYIPAGEFMMGCNEAVDNQCEAGEKPYHRVYLDAYYIDKFEVTVDQYAQCVKSKKCSDFHLTGMEWPDHSFTESDLCNWGKSNRGNHPVNCMDWSQAKEYCEWVGKRLPTEAEWEKAARGTDGRKYPWGNQTATCDYAVMSERGNGCGRNSTWPVGSKPKGTSPYGVMDMAGNAWEWVNDWYIEDNYKISSSNNPGGPSSGDGRALRGGCWYLSAESLRASYRSASLPIDRLGVVGFRCVREVK